VKSRFSRLKRIAVSERLSPKNAEKLLFDFVRFGEWTKGHFPTPEQAREIFLQHGLCLSDLIRSARHFSLPVPRFENILGPNWIVQGGGGVSIHRALPDGSSVDLTGPIEDGAEVSLRSYLSKFSAATGELRGFGETQAADRLLGAVSSGIASLDSFMNFLATCWNDLHPDEIFDLGDLSSLSEKLDDWFPAITGQGFDKSGIPWQAYLRLRRVRNELDQHDKSIIRVIRAAEFVQIGNDFAPGIAEVLFNMHVLAGLRVPSKIIRFKYFPGFYTI
jgi:hypothetical protein